MAHGIVKWFDRTEGCGLIQPDNGGADASVDISAMERAGVRDLQVGQNIWYELIADDQTGKMSADQLRVL